MPGFDNGIMYANNVDFSGSATVAAQVVTDGQLLIGSTASPNIKVGSLTSTDGSITVTAGSGTLNVSTGMLETTVVVTSAQLLDLVANPVVLIPAAGAGTFILLLKALTYMDFNSIAYDITDVASLLLYFTDVSVPAAFISPSQYLDASTDVIEIFNLGSGDPLLASGCLNTSLKFGVPAATDVTAGNSDITIFLQYKIVSTTL